MANRTAHTIAGVMAGGAAALYVSRHEVNLAARSLQVLGGLVGGGCGGRLPDIVEPAYSPNHRGVFHSIVVGGAGVAAAAREGEGALRWAWERLYELEGALSSSSGWERVFLGLVWIASHFALGYAVGLGAGYASHLVLDGATPRSLPLLG